MENTVMNTTSQPMSSNRTKCYFSEDYKFTTYGVVYSLVFIFGLLSNSGALYIFFHLSKKNRLSTIFLINLAISDILFLLSLPFRVAYYISKSDLPLRPEPEAWEKRPFLAMSCRVSTYLFYISMYCSIFFLTALSVCRYMVLSGHIRLQNRVACKLARLLCLAMWVMVVGGIVSYVAAVSGFNHKMQGCFEPAHAETWALLYHINLYTLVLGFMLPFLIVLVCYSLMIRHILQNQRGRRRLDVALICLVLTVFCLCFLPYHVQRTVHLYYIIHKEATCQLLSVLQKTVVATLCIAVANSCLDPLIFIFVGHGFGPALRTMARNCRITVCRNEGSLLSDSVPQSHRHC